MAAVADCEKFSIKIRTIAERLQEKRENLLLTTLHSDLSPSSFFLL